MLRVDLPPIDAVSLCAGESLGRGEPNGGELMPRGSIGGEMSCCTIMFGGVARRVDIGVEPIA